MRVCTREREREGHVSLWEGARERAVAADYWSIKQEKYQFVTNMSHKRVSLNKVSHRVSSLVLVSLPLPSSSLVCLHS